MLNRKACLYAVMFLAITACTKKQFAPLPTETKKEIIGIYDCDPSIPEYIHGDFNNNTLCFNTNTNSTDTFNNAYYRDSSIHLDHINLIRTNLKKTMTCQLHFVNSDLRNKTLPYVLPHVQPGYNEYAEIVITDPGKLWANNIDEDYTGNTYKGFNITITDTTGGYLSGTFNGKANTKSGKKINIENGTFYMHIINVSKN